MDVLHFILVECYLNAVYHRVKLVFKHHPPIKTVASPALITPP